MSSIQLGIALASVAAVLTNLASLLKHRGCQRVAPIQLHRPLRTARGLARSPWFAAGWALAATAWLVHVAALSMAPISLVQAVLAGGAVTLAVMSQRLFGQSVGRNQWIALGLGGAGLALLALTAPGFRGSHSQFDPAAIAGFEGGLVLISVALVVGHRSRRLAHRSGSVLAVLAGTLFALAGIAVKGLTGAFDSSLAVVAPCVVMVLVCGVLAQGSAVASLQRGDAIETIGLMGLVANAIQILGGVLVFGDPLPSSPVEIVLQLGAFAMVCSAALLLPRKANPAQTAAPRLQIA